jgi:glutamate racemase
MSNNLPIGMFDSGVGGLTVLREVIKQLPHEPTIYFGDTARVPYGSKSRDVIVRFSLEIGRFLLKKKVKMIVVACNTASAVALPQLSAKFKLPIIGVIAPGARAALDTTRTRRVGVIGTEGTIESQAYTTAIHALDQGIKVFGQPCPLIVPLVEEGWLEKPVAKEIVREYLAPLLTQRIDTLVLGCTHYPLLKELLRSVAGPKIQLIDSAQETARAVARRLDEDHLVTSSKKPGRRLFYVSDAPEKFEKIGRRFLGQAISTVQRVDIGNWV